MRTTPLVVCIVLQVETSGETSEAVGIGARSLESSTLTFFFRMAKCTKGESSKPSSDTSLLPSPTNGIAIVMRLHLLFPHPALHPY